jgi:hypothetical protein
MTTVNRSDSCDFCFGPGPFLVYEVDDFVQAISAVSVEQHVSRGGWVACYGCAEHVSERDADGLVERVVGEYRKRKMLADRKERRMFVRLVRQDYEQVVAKWTGVPVPLDELRAGCAHPQERRMMVRKNDRATGGQYDALACTACGLEFAEGKIDADVEVLADGAIRVEARKRMH